MRNWPVKPLGTLTSKIGSGATPRGGSSVYVQRGVGFIRSADVLDHRMRLDNVAQIDLAAADALRNVAVEADDVLINITGDSIARCSVVDPGVLPARVSQHVAILRSNGAVDSRYLQCVLTAPEYKARLLAMSDGGTRKALTKSMLTQLPIPLPPIEVQRAIAEVLGTLEHKIAANAVTAEAAQTVMLAVARRATGRASLGALAVRRTASLKPDAFDDQVDHYSLPAFDSDALPERTTRDAVQSNKFLLRMPSLLIAKLNPRIPRIWNIPALSSHMAVASTEFVALEPDGCSTSALWAAVSQSDFSAELQGKVVGTSGSHQRVRPAEMLAVDVLDPRTLEATDRALLDELGRSVAVVRAESARLAATRDELLPLLMSGRMTVSDAGEVAEAVT